MPGSANGLALAQALLRDRPDLKVIYTSGYSTDLFSSDVHLQDGVNYLPKPYLSSKLIKMLETALESIPAERTLSGAFVISSCSARSGIPDHRGTVIELIVDLEDGFIDEIDSRGAG